MRAWWVLPLLAAPVAAQEGEGVAGKGEDRVPALVKQLQSPEADTRAKAARALGRRIDERAVVAARVALHDTDGRVRAAAAVTLVRLGAPDDHVVATLVDALRNPDWYTRWDACVALGSVGPAAQSAAPWLIAAASDKDLDLAQDAIIAALRVAPKDPRVYAGIVRVLDSDAVLGRRLLLLALEDAGQLALARDWLAKELLENRHGLRPKAAVLLERCGVKGAMAMLEALRSERPWERAGVIYGLERQVDRVGAAVFVDALANPEPDMRRAAIAALLRRRATDAAPAIAKLLADEEPAVRLGAVQALRDLKIPVPEAGPSLVRLLAEDTRATLDAMRAAGFAALAAFLECGFELTPAGVDAAWVARLHPEGVVEGRATKLRELLGLLEDERHGAPLAAALRETLAEDEDRILVAALESEDAAVRRAGAVLLGHLARDRATAIRALRNAGKDKDADVRAAAEQALARLQE